MLRSPRIHTWVAALLATISLIATIGSALAGTTGTLRGRVVDRATHAPLVGARISAVSPSQSATATTGAQGDFVFIALAPDTYTISVEAPGFEAQSLQGVTIVADQAQTVGIDVSKTLRTIGRTTARAGASGLVKAGTTTDVYSVSPAQQTASATLGGAGSIDQAYAGLAALPGVSYDLGQAGWGQEITIRGGAQSDVAYELDGIPVQRDSDQFSTTTLSTLGQQELQVYTGGAPASADATGLSGYVNQVIRTGTTPGFVAGSAGRASITRSPSRPAARRRAATSAIMSARRARTNRSDSSISTTARAIRASPIPSPSRRRRRATAAGPTAPERSTTAAARRSSLRA